MVPRLIPTFQDLKSMAGEAVYSAFSTAAKFPKSLWLFGMSYLPTAFGQACQSCDTRRLWWDVNAEWARTTHGPSIQNNTFGERIVIYAAFVGIPALLLVVAPLTYNCYQNKKNARLKQQQHKKNRDNYAKAKELSLQHQQEAKASQEDKKKKQQILKANAPAEKFNTAPEPDKPKKTRVRKQAMTETSETSRNQQNKQNKQQKKARRALKKKSKDEAQRHQAHSALNREQRTYEPKAITVPATRLPIPTPRAPAALTEQKLKPFTSKKFSKLLQDDCRKYIATLQPILVYLTSEERNKDKDLRFNEFLTFTALLFVVPRIHLALSFLDARDMFQQRLLIQHTTMELEAKDIRKEANQLTTCLQATVVQTENPCVVVKGAMNVSHSVLFQTQPKLAELDKKDLSAEKMPKTLVDLSSQQQQDEKYFNWVRFKIVPMINLFARDIVDPVERSKLSQNEYRIRIFAIEKLLSFIGEYYKQKRRLRYEQGVSRFFPLQPENKLDPQKDLAKLFKDIRYKIRNIVDHLNTNKMHVTTDETITEFCFRVHSQVSSKIANLEDYQEDRFPYSFNSFKRKSKLNPAAKPFVPSDPEPQKSLITIP